MVGGVALPGQHIARTQRDVFGKGVEPGQVRIIQ
jgi:hypothetical protein